MCAKRGYQIQKRLLPPAYTLAGGSTTLGRNLKMVNQVALLLIFLSVSLALALALFPLFTGSTTLGRNLKIVNQVSLFERRYAAAAPTKHGK